MEIPTGHNRPPPHPRLNVPAPPPPPPCVQRETRSVQKVAVHTSADAIVGLSKADRPTGSDTTASGEISYTQAETSRLVRPLVALAASLAILACVVAGVRIRGVARQASLAKAMEEARWEDVLAIDPNNVTALIGRARARIEASSNDFESVFKDLEMVSKVSPGAAELKEVFASAHMGRAVAHARNDRLAEAKDDLEAAVRRDASPVALASARREIAKAWLARAEKAAAHKDTAALRLACDAAAKAGAAGEKVRSLRARGMIVEALTLAARGDVASAATRAAEAAILDPHVVNAELSFQANDGLRKAILAHHRARFDTAISTKSWDQAWQVAHAAETLDKASATWLQQEVAGHVTLATKLTSDDQLAEAEEELSIAVRLNADTKTLTDARNRLVAGWLARAKRGAAADDAALVRNACQAAEKAGAEPKQTASLRARGLAAESSALLARNDLAGAVTKAVEVSRFDVAVAIGMLDQPANAKLREAVLSECRRKFDEAVAKKAWAAASDVAVLAGNLDRAASQWIGTAVASHSAEVSCMPAALLAMLPLSVVGDLPPIQNSIGMKLKLIPAGTFSMGELDDDAGETQHQVTLTQGYYLGVYEVTNAQWSHVMGKGARDGDDRPVANVSWEVADEFCRRLSALPEERNVGAVYRLPTEAEWEYACRAGTTTMYSFGNHESRLGSYAWFGNNSGDQVLDAAELWDSEDDDYGSLLAENGCRSHPVGTKRPNQWGLFDMHGNVHEWCSDWHGRDVVESPVTDPTGPAPGSERIFRGGSWFDPAKNCRSAGRESIPPDEHLRFLGFRVARNIAQAPAERNRESEDRPSRDRGRGTDVPLNVAFKAVLAERPIRNSVGMQLKLIPPGTFTMGDVRGGREEMPHQVSLTKPYSIGVHEVTNAQWRQVMGAIPSRSTGDDHPVERIAWKDAVAFCQKLSSLPEEKKAGRIYRLPTEAEWEYACRAGTDTPFYTGFRLSARDAKFAAVKLIRPADTVPVGSFRPNPWGLFDMHGNVWEWTHDWFDAGYYEHSQSDDPPGPENGTHHTLRGGSASTLAEECRASFRGEASGDSPGSLSDTDQRYKFYGDFGVRVVMTSPEFDAGFGQGSGDHTSD